MRNSGSLAHIYFNVTTERMDVSEIAILYPDLVDALVRHPGIGLVLGVEEGRPIITGPHGTAALTSDRLPRSRGSRAGRGRPGARVGVPAQR